MTHPMATQFNAPNLRHLRRYLFEIHGCTDGRLAKNMYLSLQAAQLCCGGKSDGLIRKVLNLAIAALPKDLGE